ncbi:MAG: hypothetical protein M3Y17_00815 [Actinomycetota bacterium]|nr:hypothetical protein [Actinomycetota bacterium]
MAIVVALMAVLPAAAATARSESARSARGKLVVHVRVDGVLTPDGRLGSAPAVGAHITVTGQAQTVHRRAGHRGVAEVMLRPGHYKVSIRLSAPYSSEPRTAVLRAGTSTTVFLIIVCDTC